MTNPMIEEALFVMPIVDGSAKLARYPTGFDT